MTQSEFYEKLRETVQEKMGGIPVHLQESVKNNNIIHTSIVIDQKEQEITPSIHLEPMYRHYRNGWEMDQTAELVIQTWQSYQKQKPDISISEFTDWQKAKEKIYFRLFSARHNPRYIQEGICQDYLDMVLVAYYHAAFTDSGVMGIRITRETVEKMWHVSNEEVCRVAEANTPGLFPPQISGLPSLLLESLEKQLGTDSIPQNIREILEQNPMYILQNEQGINGATVITYQNLLPQLYEKLGGGFYIIPSSIHEVLVLPDTKEIDEKWMGKVIFQINREHVEPEEQLTDSLYHYNGNELRIAREGSGRNE